MNPGDLAFAGDLWLALPLPLAAGLLSFVSPCVLPLVPGYLSAISGISITDMRADFARDIDRMERDVRAEGFTPGNHADYEPGRRFYFHEENGIEIEVVSYS